MVKRKQPPGEGLWAIPGGRVELGETLQEAAEREVGEETGVTIRAGNPVYTFDLIERDDAGRIRYHYIIVDLMADYIGGKPSPSDDACEARWVTSEELNDLPASQATREVLRKTALFGRNRKCNSSASTLFLSFRPYGMADKISPWPRPGFFPWTLSNFCRARAGRAGTFVRNDNRGELLQNNMNIMSHTDLLHQQKNIPGISST